MKKTKHYFALHDGGGFAICTPDVKVEATEAEWKDVTCKNCLKHRKAKP
jgi:hypothetical protein